MLVGREEKKHLVYTEVIDAIRDNDVIRLRELVHNGEFSADDTIPIRYANSYGMTCFGLAIKNFKISKYTDESSGLDVIKLLLEKGIDVNKRDIASNTALILLFKRYDIESCHRVKILKLLLEAGADVNIQDARERNVLHLAISSLRVYSTIDQDYAVDVIKLLLEKGVNVNKIGVDNDTALTLLSRRCDIDNDFKINLMKLFLEAGADINIKGLKGRTILHNYSLDTCYAYSIDSYIEIIIFCLKNGADANLTDDEQLLPVNYVYLTDNLYSKNSIIGIILCIASYKAIFNFDWSHLSKHYSCDQNVESIVFFQKERVNYFINIINKIFLDFFNEENNNNIACIYSLIMDCDLGNMERVIGIEKKELLKAFQKIDINCRELERICSVKKYYLSDIIFKILDIRASKSLESYKDKLVVDSLIGLIQVVSGQNIVIDFPINSYKSFLSYGDAYNLCLVSKIINLSAYTNISERDIYFVNKVNSFRKELNKYCTNNIIVSNSNANSSEVITKTGMIGVSLLLLFLLFIAVIATFMTSLYWHPSNSEEITSLLIVSIMPFTILTFVIISLNHFNHCFPHVKNLSERVEFPDVQEIDCVLNCMSS